MLRSYLKLAVKVLQRRKFFTAVSLFGISFTLVVLTVVVAVLDNVLAAKAPETHLDRTISSYHVRVSGPEGRRGFPETGFRIVDQYMRGIPGVERLSLFSTNRDVPAYVGGKPVICVIKRTDGEYWRVHDFTFTEGGPFTNEDVEKVRFVAVITEAMRRRFFGGETALGRTIEVDAQRLQVVGVVPDVSKLRPNAYSEIWVPHTTEKSDLYRTNLRTGGYVAVFLARRPADIPGIREEFRARLKRVPIAAETQNRLDRIVGHLENRLETIVRTYTSALFLYDEDMRPHPERFFMGLGILALLFMLIPTLNLVNLNVSRILERSSEIGVRKAFGATSRTLVGQFVVENVVLTVVGGAIGFILAWVVLGAIGGSGLLPYTTFEINHRVFLWGLGLAVFFGVLSGVYPAWRMSRLHPVQALKGGAR
jgi:putative ABC transport system permease protein